MRWRAWFADGGEYDSRSAAWDALPQSGCVIVKWWPDDGAKRLECGDDAILLVGNEFVSVNLPTEEFRSLAGLYATRGTLKFGEAMKPEDYAALYEKALLAADPGE